jgi:hypothetical protein
MKIEECNRIDDCLKWHFFNLYCMALSDTDFDPREAELLYKIGLEHGIDKATINEIVVTSGIRPVQPENLEEKISYLYDMTRMAWADGIIEDSEKRLLKKFVIRFGFHEENSDSIVAFLLESIQKRKNMRDIINDIKS